MNKMEYNPLLPVVYGNEQETSLQIVHRGGMRQAGPEDGTDFIFYDTITNPTDVIPCELYRWGDFLGNGYRVSNATRISEGGLQAEIATPECATLEQVVVSTRTSELILKTGVEEYLNIEKPDSKDGRISARIQKRVVDSMGNTWGCHDNFGFYPEVLKDITPFLDKYLGYFLATRSIVVGAGLVDMDGGFHYAQKIGFINKMTGHEYCGRYFRDASAKGDTIGRIEVASGDANISDWATRMRIGSTAILLAILTSEEHEQLDPFIANLSNEETLAHGKSINTANISATELDFTEEQYAAMYFQQMVAETYLKKLPEEAYNPELALVARQLIRFCGDARAVARGEMPLTAIADRADWALKYSLINSRMARDQANGVQRDIGDMKSRADDLRYDYLGIEPKDNGGFFYEPGQGLRLRDRRAFAYTVPERLIRDMYYTPPPTRASARAKLLNSDKIIFGAGWDFVTLENGRSRKIHELRDPRSPVLTKGKIEKDQNQPDKADGVMD